MPYKNPEDQKINVRNWQRKNKKIVNAKSLKWKNKNRKHIAIYDKIRNTRFPEILKAHNEARKIIIPKESICEICGCPDRLEKHHSDYSKPLEVKFLCKDCHMRLHKSKEFENGR